MACPSAGLSATGDQWITQNTTGILDSAEADDSFGYVMAAGDFDGDGFEDLAVGVVAEDVGSLTAAGAVNVIYGTSAGLSATGNQYWTQAGPDPRRRPRARGRGGERGLLRLVGHGRRLRW